MRRAPDPRLREAASQRLSEASMEITGRSATFTQSYARAVNPKCPSRWIQFAGSYQRSRRSRRRADSETRPPDVPFAAKPRRAAPRSNARCNTSLARVRHVRAGRVPGHPGRRSRYLPRRSPLPRRARSVRELRLSPSAFEVDARPRSRPRRRPRTPTPPLPNRPGRTPCGARRLRDATTNRCTDVPGIRVGSALHADPLPPRRTCAARP